MKHTDTLLGIIEQEKQQAAADNGEAKLALQALQSLAEHPGWKLYLERLQLDRAIALVMLAKVSGDQLGKVAGILVQVESDLAWLGDTAAQLAQQLKG